jgi:hypothetical protein
VYVNRKTNTGAATLRKHSRKHSQRKRR